MADDLRDQIAEAIRVHRALVPGGCKCVNALARDIANAVDTHIADRLGDAQAGRALEQAALANALPIIARADAARAALLQGGQSASIRARSALRILAPDLHRAMDPAHPAPEETP